MMRLFGTLLPYLAFSEVPCMEDGGPRLHPQHDPGYRCVIFACGWLGFGLSVVWPGSVREASR